LDKLFHFLDRDGSGALEFREFLRAVRRAKVPKDQISDAGVYVLFKEVDIDQSGTVHVDEIVSFIGPAPPRMSREQLCEETMVRFHSLNARGIATCAYDKWPSPVKMMSSPAGSQNETLPPGLMEATKDAKIVTLDQSDSAMQVSELDGNEPPVEAEGLTEELAEEEN
jgi:hypothetical protein